MSIRIDKVVTRGGDGGETSLGDGARVGKDSARIEALGALDEVNATIGLVRAHAETAVQEPGVQGAGVEATGAQGEAAGAHSPRPVVAELAALQNLLFDIGADLCQPEGPRTQRARRVEDGVIAEIEEWIEQMRALQQPLRGFVLPGGSLAACWAHMARTQVRRAERQVVALARQEQVNPAILKILNRLSDYFFVLARYFNHDGQADLLWTPAAQA